MGCFQGTSHGRGCMGGDFRAILRHRQNDDGGQILTAIQSRYNTRDAARLCSAISPKIPATAAAGVFVTTSTRRLIAEEAILAGFRRTRLIYG